MSTSSTNFPGIARSQSPSTTTACGASKASTKGEHGLPLIGSGDWNDGMNRVGIDGKGESVWLAWFLNVTLREFAEHAEERGDRCCASGIQGSPIATAQAVEATAWDGAWYRRAYYDDGAPLGSRDKRRMQDRFDSSELECHLACGDPERARTAMKSFNEHLVREDARLHHASYSVVRSRLT